MSDATQIPTLDEIYQAKKDVKDINTFATSTDLTFVDSTGRDRKTIDGVIVETAETMGWFIQGNFSSGFTFTARNQVGRDNDGELWSYNGPLNTGGFAVPAGTTPTEPNYTNRGDAALRSDLSKSNGASLIKTLSGDSVQKVLSDLPAVVVAQADRAEAAADAAALSSGVYPDTTAGLAAVPDGEYFSVPSNDSTEYLILYRKIGSSAEQISIYPSRAAIDDLGIEGMDSDVSGLSFAVVDQNNRRTWLEADNGGGPTARSAGLLKDAIGAVTLVDIENQDINEPHFAIVDQDNRRTWLECNEEGKPTERVAEIIRAAAGALDGISSGPNIACWGDSMTAGAGGGGVTYCNVLQGLLNVAGYTGSVYNLGVGGETSVTIAGRANANPFIVDVAGGEIPESGQVALTLRQINGQLPAPLKQGASSYSATLLGVAGTFGRTIAGETYNYWFQRATAGTPVVANRPTPLYLDIGEQRRSDIAIIWIGQNGPNNERAIQDAYAIIRHMSSVDKRYLVISKPGGGTAQNADDARWFEEFGRRFIPIRQYMVEFGLQDAGIEPTAQDLTDIANGTVPTSLRTDSVHWKAAGYQILGRIVFERLNELGWI